MEQLLIGRLLADRYRVEEILGRGGMSVVYRAVDTRLGRPVAIKIVAFPPDVDPSGRQMLREWLRREAAAVACLSSHPNVVQVYDHGTDDSLDIDFITMELLLGNDLKQLLARGGIQIDRGVEILRAAIQGVAAGHRAGIVHRDVKPANIFLSGTSGQTTIKVLDFGIAKALDPAGRDDLTRHDHVPHSPAYASPEQLAMRGETFASDVYQLGLVGYELLAGERPFTPDDRQRIAQGEVVPLPEGERWSTIPEPIREVIRTALSIDPSRRFSDAMAMAVAFESAVDDDVTIALPGAGKLRENVEEPPSGAVSNLSTDSETSAPQPAVAAPMHPGGGPRREAVRESSGWEGTMLEPSDLSAPGRHARRGRPWTLYAAGIALLLMMVWLLSRDPVPAVPTAGVDPGVDADAPLSNVEVQDTEMRPLMLQAFENLESERANR